MTRYRTLPPTEALRLLDAMCGHARKAAMQDARASFQEALRAHGGRLDAEDVERVLLGLETPLVTWCECPWPEARTDDTSVCFKCNCRIPGRTT